MIKSFPCNLCGLCCRNISGIDELKQFDKGDGVCVHLNEENECSIYDDRPNICRIDEMYERVYYEHFTKKEYYFENVLACRTLQKKAGFTEDNMITLDDFLEE